MCVGSVDDGRRSLTLSFHVREQTSCCDIQSGPKIEHLRWFHSFIVPSFWRRRKQLMILRKMTLSILICDELVVFCDGITNDLQRNFQYTDVVWNQEWSKLLRNEKRWSECKAVLQWSFVKATASKLSQDIRGFAFMRYINPRLTLTLTSTVKDGNYWCIATWGRWSRQSFSALTVGPVMRQHITFQQSANPRSSLCKLTVSNFADGCHVWFGRKCISTVPRTRLRGPATNQRTELMQLLLLLLLLLLLMLLLLVTRDLVSATHSTGSRISCFGYLHMRITPHISNY